MTSVHVQRSIRVAQEIGAWSGSEASTPLWKLSKREIIEVALHLANQLVADGCALSDGRAAEMVLDEFHTLRSQGFFTRTGGDL